MSRKSGTRSGKVKGAVPFLKARIQIRSYPALKRWANLFRALDARDQFNRERQVGWREIRPTRSRLGEFS